MSKRELARFDPSATAEDIVAAVCRDGCAVIEELADGPTMDAVEQELTPHMAATPKGDGAIMGFETKRTSGLMAKSTTAGTLATKPACPRRRRSHYSEPTVIASRSCQRLRSPSDQVKPRNPFIAMTAFIRSVIPTPGSASSPFYGH